MSDRTKGDPRVEQAVLGAILIQPDLLSEVQVVLTEEEFTDEMTRKVYTTMLRMRAEGRSIDIVTVSHQLRDGKTKKDPTETLAEWMADVPAAAGCIDYAKDLARLSAKRKILLELNDYTKVLATSHDGLEQAPEVARRIVQQVPDESTNKPIHMKKLLEKERERFEQGHGAPDTTSGVEDVDRDIDIFDPGSYTIIAGRPSMGKSTFMRQLIRANCDKVVCLVYTLEDQPITFLEAMACSEAGVNTESYWKGYATKEEEEKVWGEANRLAQQQIYVYPKYTVDASLIRAHVEAFRTQYDRVAVFVDYIQLMEHNRERGESLTQAIGRTSRTLTLTALDFQVPMILLAQLNRECENRAECRPELVDLRDCGSLEQDADNILFIFSDQPQENWRRFRLAKRRRGRQHEIRGVTFIKEMGQFHSMPPSEQPEYTSSSGIKRRKAKEPTTDQGQRTFDPFDMPRKEDDVGF